MVSRTLRSWIPRPKTFLGFISLQNGTEMITLTLMFNKLTGVYGLLAILTGFELNLIQLSAYVYSFAILGLLAYILPHIRKQSPFQVLLLAWVYVLDTLLNAAFTTIFALNWFANSTALERHPGPSDDAVPINSGVPDATLAQGTPVLPDVPKTTKHIGPAESWTSLGLVVLFTVIRVYLAVVVMAFAQYVLSRQSSNNNGWEPEDRKMDNNRELFAVGSPDGEGLQSRLGRKMLSVGRGYWLDERAQEDWAKSVNSKFRHAAAQV